MFGQFGRFACERRAARRRVCAGGFERILKASFLGDAGWLAVACPVDPREKLARGGRGVRKVQSSKQKDPSPIPLLFPRPLSPDARVFFYIVIRALERVVGFSDGRHLRAWTCLVL